MSEKTKLYYVPIAHTSNEVMAVAGQLNDDFVLRMYQGIRTFTGHLPVDLSSYIVFNDGYTFDIVDKVNDRRKREDFRISLLRNGFTPTRAPQDYLILDLLQRRARLVAVEDSRLVAEQRVMMRMPNWSDAMSKRFEELNGLRDRNIVREIDKILKKRRDATGILFMGGAHKVDERLRAKGISFVVPEDMFQFVSQVELLANPYLARFAR